MEKLVSYFSAKGISSNDVGQIIDAFTFKKMAKGDLFAEEGKASKYLAFITKGIFQYFI
ncbi:MAG TPA: hypothetical protein VFW07_00085 [Parafilimonas sp.]|nr:hypothetical protein [Parafilimonas sp.]